MKSHFQCKTNCFSNPESVFALPISEFLRSKWDTPTSKAAWFAKLNSLETDVGGFIWRAPWIGHTSLMYRCGQYPWVPLLRIYGGISYAPALVRRQLGSKQFVPMTHGLCNLDFSYGEHQGISRVKEAVEAWHEVHEARHGTLTDITTSCYIDWLKDREKRKPILFGKIPTSVPDEAQDVEIESQLNRRKEFKRMKIERDVLSQENGQLKRKLEEEKAESRRHARQLERVRECATSFQTKLEGRIQILTEELTGAFAELSEIEKKNDVLKKNLETRTGQLGESQEKIEVQQMRIQSLQQDVRKATCEYHRLREEYEKLTPSEELVNERDHWRRTCLFTQDRADLLIENIRKVSRRAEEMAKEAAELQTSTVPTKSNKEAMKFVGKCRKELEHVGRFY